MQIEIDILEKDREVLDILVRDNTTQNNILWLIKNYEYLGKVAFLNYQSHPN